MDELWQEKTMGSKIYCFCHALLRLQEMLNQQVATSRESLLIKTLNAVYFLRLVLRSGGPCSPGEMQSW